MSLKAVLFDFNGVIINDEPVHKELIEQILLEENLRPDATEHNEVCLGRSDRACLATILSRRGRVVSDEFLDKLLAKKTQRYRQRLQEKEQLPIYEGIANFINELWQGGLILALVTGARREDVEYILDRINLREPFAAIVTSDDIQTSKPNPEGYLKAVDSLNQIYPHRQLTPQNCLVIEDTPSGIEAAKTAKMQVVGVANTYPLHMLQRQANWAVDYLQELELERVKQQFADVKIDD